MSPQRWTTLGQLRLVAGEAWESPANMLLRTPSRWLRPPKETLYILLTLSGPPLLREPLEGAAATALAEELFKARGSITARLQKGIEAANRMLWEKNRWSLPEERRYGGTVCLLLRGRDAYLAQAGPPRAYLLQGGKFRSYASKESKALLGREERVAVHLAHFPLTGGSRILLTDRPWEEPALQKALAKPDVGSAWQALVALAPAADSSVWLIGPASEASEIHTLEGITPQERQVMRATQPEVQVQSRRPGQPARSPWQPLSRVGRRAWRWFGRMGREVGEGVLPREAPPSAKRGARNVGARLGSLIQPYLPLVAFGIPLLALLLTGLLYWSTQVERSVEFATYLRQAQEAIAIAAQPGTDETTARVHLQSALTQIDAALALRPGLEDAQRMRAEAQYRLDMLNKVTRLAFIHPLYEYPPGSQPSRVLEVEGAIYVLDRGTNQVYHHLLGRSGQSLAEGETRILLRQGQEVDGESVGPLADMAWLPSDEGGRLLILDQQGLLFAYTPGIGVGRLTLPGLGEGAGVAHRLATYGGRLYVLAPEQGQVLRYYPTENGFGQPEPYFPSATEIDLSGVADMAIDGYVYLLWENGLVRRFLAGKEQPLLILLPDESLGKTTALFACLEEEAASLYVLDAERQRVVQLSKEGELIRQLKAQDPALFAELYGLFVEESKGRMLITDGRQLLLAEVPPLSDQ